MTKFKIFLIPLNFEVQLNLFKTYCVQFPVESSFMLGMKQGTVMADFVVPAPVQIL